MLQSPVAQGSNWPLHAAFLFCLLGTNGGQLHAQHWSDGMLDGGDWNGAITSFETTWSDSTPQRGKGFKPFMRWRHFAEARFAFDSALSFEADAVWSATQWERAGRQARTAETDTVWKRAVPEGLPLIGGAGRINRVVVDPLDTSRWFACAPSGGVWFSDQSGLDWTLMGTQDWAGMGASDIALHPDLPDCILAATGDSDFGSAYAIGLMQTCDGGQTWEPTGLSFAMAEGKTCSRVHRKAGDPDQILAATSDGLWLSEDGGVSFTRTLEGIFSDLLPHPGDSSVWHAAKRPGELYRSTDGGRNWALIPGMPSLYLASRYTLATSASNPAQVVAIAAKSGSQGLLGLYISADSGATYTEVPDLPNLLGWTVNGIDAGGQGFYDLALAVDPLDSQHMVAGGINLWESFDGGSQWACRGHWFGGDSASFVHADQHALTFIPGTSEWISAHDGGVARLTAGDIRDVSTGLEVAQVYHLAWSEMQPGRLISGWQDNGVNLLKRGEHAQVLGADGFHCLIDPLGPDTLVAAEYYGKAYRSNDGGWSWQPWIWSNAEGVNEQGDWNTPMAYAPNQPNRVFVAKRRVYWSDDAGASWNQTEAVAGPAIEVLAIARAADSTVAVARGTNAFVTHNLSEWTPYSGLPGLPVLDIVFNDTNANYMWLAFGGYAEADRVWTSEDGGAHWSSSSEGLPALPVNAIVRDNASGDLYAGTDAGVYVKTSDSTAWQPYKSGLPEVLCSDLGIRRATGEILLATYGSGLWKAPLHAPATRDAAITAINGAKADRCSGPLNVTATLRNAGSDTLVATTLIWNDVDTVSYGFALAPNATQRLTWPDAQRGAVSPGEHLTVRILDVVGLDGDLATGQLAGGPDEVSENDVLGVPWEHREGTGEIVMATLADCNPMESAWALADSTGQVWHRRQHFPIESVVYDTLCLSHGCFDVLLHDMGANGFTGALCGMEGALDLLSIHGDTVWSVSSSGAAGIGFSSGIGGEFCLPLPGLSGCTDATACNFDPTAAADDGTCGHDCLIPACAADMDGDGLYGASDVLSLLAEFGCLSDCTVDITGDGTVSANDVLALLALYGESCTE